MRLPRFKRWKKLALVFLALLFFSQLPFIYRRFELRRLSRAIGELNSSRLNQTDNSYQDYKGVVHVHSELGGHSTGNFTEIIQAAQDDDLNFVVMTEHTSALYNTAQMTLNGTHGGVLFINGNEVKGTGNDHLLVMPGDESEEAVSATTEEAINRAKQRGALSFAAYPQEFQTWQAANFDGIEVYNLYTNVRRLNAFTTFFDTLWSYRGYPDLMFAFFKERPGAELRIWDEAMAAQNRRLGAIAGNDAHANIGFSFTDAAGHKYLQLQLDPYERSFRLVRTHVLIEKERPLDNASLLSALQQGHAYISFDILADASGFMFTAENSSGRKIMGDEIALENGVRLSVQTPIKSRIVILKDGQVYAEESAATSKDVTVNQKGVYRVEVYLDQLPRPLTDKLWIISNPIYIR